MSTSLLKNVKFFDFLFAWSRLMSNNCVNLLFWENITMPKCKRRRNSNTWVLIQDSHVHTGCPLTGYILTYWLRLAAYLLCTYVLFSYCACPYWLRTYLLTGCVQATSYIFTNWLRTCLLATCWLHTGWLRLAWCFFG